MLYRGDNRIQDCSTKNRRVFGLGSSFGEPQVSVGRAIELRKTQNPDADSFLMEEGTTAVSR